jgi:two-component system phosphate regulon sensor histidine kinase PhoR
LTQLRFRFVWKLFAGFAVLILVTAGIVGFLVSGFVERETLATVDRQLENEAGLLHDLAADGLAQPDDSEALRALREMVGTLGGSLGTRFTVMDAGGVVVADSAEDPWRMDNHATRPEILEAARTGLGTASRFSRTVEQRMRYLAVPLEHDGARLGFVRTSLPLTLLEERLRHLRGLVLLGTLIAVAAGLALSGLLAPRFTRPLRAMATRAESIAQGAYAQRVAVTSHDELGQLAVAFNTMSEELHRSAATLAADRNKLTAILSSMVEGVVAVDRDERIVHVNKVAGRLLELDREDSVGRPIWEATRVREVTEILSETLRTQEICHRRSYLPGSPNRCLDLRASPLRAHGDLVGAVLVLHDLTRLQHLEAMRRDFVGNVSHEVKTPVTVIRGLVETLIEDPELETSLRQRFLGKIGRQAARLSSLVTDLLSLSRLESEERPLELSPLDVRDVLEESLRAIDPAGEARRITLNADWSEEPLFVDGDDEALRQAVSNLLDNAVKYSPEGSQVTLRARQNGGQVVIEVADEGPGIEPRHHERLFERFYRVDAARSRELGGTGLGLAIVKHTVLALGGEVAFESKPGEGSTFRITLPPSRQPLEPAADDGPDIG